MINVNFLPFVGCNYCDGGIFGKKILYLAAYNKPIVLWDRESFKQQQKIVRNKSFL